MSNVIYLNRERRITNGNLLYIVIDVRDRDGSLLRVMYATPGKYGGVVWTPCGEGLNFVSIMPYGLIEEEPANDKIPKETS